MTETKFQIANKPPKTGLIFTLVIKKKTIKGLHASKIKRQKLFKVESEELLPGREKVYCCREIST